MGFMDGITLRILNSKMHSEYLKIRNTVKFDNLNNIASLRLLFFTPSIKIIFEFFVLQKKPNEIDAHLLFSVIFFFYALIANNLKDSEFI